MIVNWNNIKHFKPHETACKCGCGLNDMDHDLMLKLDHLRELVGRISINSGARCLEWNRKQGSKDTSSHIKCLAVDIKCIDGKFRYKLLNAAIHVGFNRIGIHKRFIHLDVDTEKTEETSWLY